MHVNFFVRRISDWDCSINKMSYNGGAILRLEDFSQIAFGGAWAQSKKFACQTWCKKIQQ